MRMFFEKDIDIDDPTSESAFINVMTMSLTVKSKRYVYSALKFTALMIQMWLLSPLMLAITVFDFLKYGDADSEYEMKVLLFIFLLSPLLLMLFSFTHIKKDEALK